MYLYCIARKVFCIIDKMNAFITFGYACKNKNTPRRSEAYFVMKRLVFGVYFFFYMVDKIQYAGA